VNAPIAVYCSGGPDQVRSPATREAGRPKRAAEGRGLGNEEMGKRRVISIPEANYVTPSLRGVLA